MSKFGFYVLHVSLMALNPPRDKYEFEDLELKDLDDEQERFDKAAIDTLIKKLKDEFNYQKKNDKFRIEI